MAQDWADHLAQSNSFDHREENIYGENLFQIDYTHPTLDGFTLNGADPVKDWYNEIQNYNYFGSEPDLDLIDDWGHMTQLLWKGSTEVGVGLAVGNGGKTVYVVGNYNPSGNIDDCYAENVLCVDSR